MLSVPPSVTDVFALSPEVLALAADQSPGSQPDSARVAVSATAMAIPAVRSVDLRE
jgi:hypothetical protein